MCNHSKSLSHLSKYVNDSTLKLLANTTPWSCMPSKAFESSVRSLRKCCRVSKITLDFLWKNCYNESKHTLDALAFVSYVISSFLSMQSPTMQLWRLHNSNPALCDWEDVVLVLVVFSPEGIGDFHSRIFKRCFCASQKFD